MITIDLKGSAAGLYFDTRSGGQGVGVHAPVSIESGREALSAVAQVADGSKVLALMLRPMPPRPLVVVIRMDVDDRLTSGPRGPTQIVGSEIQGAGLRVRAVSPSGLVSQRDARFDAQGMATVHLPGCEPIG